MPGRSALPLGGKTPFARILLHTREEFAGSAPRPAVPMRGERTLAPVLRWRSPTGPPWSGRIRTRHGHLRDAAGSGTPDPLERHSWVSPPVSLNPMAPGARMPASATSSSADATSQPWSRAILARTPAAGSPATLGERDAGGATGIPRSRFTRPRRCEMEPGKETKIKPFQSMNRTSVHEVRSGPHPAA